MEEIRGKDENNNSFKSLAFDYEIQTKYPKDNWRMLLMERILIASLIAIFDTVNKFKPVEEWSWRTDCESA